MNQLLFIPFSSEVGIAPHISIGQEFHFAYMTAMLHYGSSDLTRHGAYHEKRKETKRTWSCVCW